MYTGNEISLHIGLHKVTCFTVMQFFVVMLSFLGLNLLCIILNFTFNSKGGSLANRRMLGDRFLIP